MLKVKLTIMKAKEHYITSRQTEFKGATRELAEPGVLKQNILYETKLKLTRKLGEKKQSKKKETLSWFF